MVHTICNSDAGIDSGLRRRPTSVSATSAHGKRQQTAVLSSAGDGALGAAILSFLYRRRRPKDWSEGPVVELGPLPSAQDNRYERHAMPPAQQRRRRATMALGYKGPVARLDESEPPDPSRRLALRTI